MLNEKLFGEKCWIGSTCNLLKAAAKDLIENCLFTVRNITLWQDIGISMGIVVGKSDFVLLWKSIHDGTNFQHQRSHFFSAIFLPDYFWFSSMKITLSHQARVDFSLFSMLQLKRRKLPQWSDCLKVQLKHESRKFIELKAFVGICF